MESIRLRSGSIRFILAAALVLGAAYSYWRPAETHAQSASLLAGRVTSTSGGAVAGVPVRARKNSGTFAVSVYTNSNGEYSFPDWADVSAGSYAVSITLPDFVHASREGVTLAAGKTAKVDFQLEPRTPSVEDATASEIIAALPGTDAQKHLFIQCDNCHTLQWALRNPKTKEQWVTTITRMAGRRNSGEHTPGTRSFQQKQYIEPLAEYLTSIRGPGSSSEIPFQLRPRPTSAAATRLVVTEYDIPRGGQRELYMLRGDRRFVWPHDVLVDSDPAGPYVWYTDHFSNAIGRVNVKTGDAREFQYSLNPDMGRAGQMAALAQGEERAGNPGGGAHTIVFDREGKLAIGADDATLRFDRRTYEFTLLEGGSSQFGMDPAGDKIWYQGDEGVVRLSLASGERKLFRIAPEGMELNRATYGMDTDSQGRSIFNLWRLGKMGVFDPRTEKFMEYPVPTAGSGPRRGEIDAEGNAWVGLYWAGRVAKFDPDTGESQEFPLLPGQKAYTAPYPSPYTASVDDKNQIVWANDFNSGRIFSIDMKTGNSTEHFMPHPYEIRDLMTDESAERPTVWIPSYRPPAQMVRVQLR
jgi:streptogramin lyase